MDIMSGFQPDHGSSNLPIRSKIREVKSIWIGNSVLVEWRCEVPQVVGSIPTKLGFRPCSLTM